MHLSIETRLAQGKSCGLKRLCDCVHGRAGKSPNLLEITPADASDRSIEIHKMRWERPYKRVGSQWISPAKYGATSLSLSLSLSRQTSLEALLRGALVYSSFAHTDELGREIRMRLASDSDGAAIHSAD